MVPALRDVLSLITARHCKRAFLDRAVPRDALCEAYRGDRPRPGSANRPPSLDDVVERRARAATSGVLPAKGHAAADTAAAWARFRGNLRFYGAPTAGYADIVRLKLGIDAERLVVCTLAAGHADEAAPVIRFIPQQARLEEYVQWSC
ncbi:hypothetical protein ABZ746_30580 [Streptomyces sp. NPDC020096]